MQLPCIEVSVGRGARVRRTLAGPCRVVVGSSSACDLRVVSRGVRAAHLVVEWDGSRLTVRFPGVAPFAAAPLPRAVSGTAVFRLGEATVTVSAASSGEGSDRQSVAGEDVTQVSLPALEKDAPAQAAVRTSYRELGRRWAALVARAGRAAFSCAR